MDIITSRHNPLIVETAKLRDKKYRDAARLFPADGRKLFREAAAAIPDAIQRVFVTPEFYEENKNELLNFNVTVVSTPIFEKISPESSPEGVVCVLRYIDFFHNYITIYNASQKGERIFAAHEVRDPGNLGTIIRTAFAFGYDRLLLSDCADIYNPKTVRAAMGALFRMKITICTDMAGSLDALRREGRMVYAAALDRDARPLDTMPPDPDAVYLVGNEGHGLPDSLIAHTDGTVFIPIAAESESLNAAIAAAVLLWHNR